MEQNGTAFPNSEALHGVMQDLWNAIKGDKGMSEKLLSSKLAVRFHYREPEGTVTIDCRDGKEMKIHVAHCDIKPDVEMEMKSEVAHEFWLGKVSVPMAILTGKIVAKGPVQKALALLPAVSPAFKIYPDIYKTYSAGLKSSV